MQEPPRQRISSLGEGVRVSTDGGLGFSAGDGFVEDEEGGAWEVGKGGRPMRWDEGGLGMKDEEFGSLLIALVVGIVVRRNGEEEMGLWAVESGFWADLVSGMGQVISWLSSVLVIAEVRRVAFRVAVVLS